nr:hypothetical protein GCM10020092_029350 [Actinoplanes digitatis]
MCPWSPRRSASTTSRSRCSPTRCAPACSVSCGSTARPPPRSWPRTSTPTPARPATTCSRLAEAGLVIEEPGAGRGRERWWRSAHDISSWQRDSFAGDPDALAASDWLDGFHLRHLVDRVERWQGVRADESPRWRTAAGFSDYLLNLGTEQLTALTAELDTVIERYRALGGTDPAPDARQVLLYVYTVPRVE